jgi:SAM-dependent methyltransferase
MTATLYQALKRILPQPVKRGLRRTLGTARFLFQPAALTPPPHVRATIRQAAAERGLDADQLNLRISKHCTMFAYTLAFAPDRDQAMQDHLRGGLAAFDVLDGVVRDSGRTWQQLDSILDFASGYGRSTRYVVAAVSDPARICVSDIKARAVRYQQAHFGVRGVVSASRPEDFSLRDRFNLVWVGSLFSHLPTDTFGRWLAQLGGLLAPAGTLAFTTHGALPGEGYVFRDASEETGGVPGFERPLPGAEYGTTHVSEAFVRKAIVEAGLGRARVTYRPLGIWGTQDIWIVSI